MRSLNRDKDTICATATAHGIGAISVIRISGTEAAKITRKIAAFLPENLESHKIYYGVLRDKSGSPIDEVLLSYFAKGRSFTGEETIEISCHGSELVTSEILRELISNGARLAERGEFTYRAFMNGRLDLVQAESVLALIESRSKRASSLALRQLQGELSRHLKGFVDSLTWILAQLEANIDFASEDIVIASNDQLRSRASQLLSEVDRLLRTHRTGRVIRNGYQVLLVGRPNAGKSSLLNSLVEEERAIVTPIAGTTRDFVEAELQVEGARVLLIDSAGLRVTDDPVEKIGVERTLAKVKEVDLVFYVTDSSEGIGAEDREFFSQWDWDRCVVVANKSDLNPDWQWRENLKPVSILKTSVVNREGLRELRGILAERIRNELAEDSTLLIHARHQQNLEILKRSLEDVIPMLERGESPDLIALELQTGLQALYEILGLTYDDQVMDRVFSEFCLGK